MKYLIIALLLAAPLPDPNKIARTNALKKEAKAAYEKGNFEEAINTYHYLLDSMKIDEDAIRINLANAYYQNGDTTGAVTNYELLRDSENRKLASRAYQQLGVIKNKQKNREEALADFKQALRKDPANEEARYNYEMLKKLLDQERQDQQNQEQQNQEQNQDENKDQQQDQEQQQDQKSDQQQDQEQKQDQEGKEGDEQDEQKQQSDDQQKKNEEKKKEGKPDEPSDKESDDKEKQDQLNTSPDRFKDSKVSEEKARMILEALKNQEVQYLQQQKRRTQETPPSDKPDW